jgi:hypothetical protein
MSTYRRRIARVANSEEPGARDVQARICGGPGWATTQVYPARIDLLSFSGQRLRPHTQFPSFWQIQEWVDSMWRHLSLTVLQAEYRTERACELPEYLGSTLRGALGQELRAVSCIERDSPCAVCRRPDRCASGALFDGPVADATGSLAEPSGEERQRPTTGGDAGGFDRPRPYILAPPPRLRGTYSPGETIRFGVTLVGRGRTWYPWVIAALEGDRQARLQRRTTALVAGLDQGRRSGRHDP